MFFSDSYLPYAVNHTDSTVAFLSSLPEDMRPMKGQVVASSTVKKPFDFGFSGRVAEIIDKGDSIVYRCEPISISDIYERIIAVGSMYNESAAEARRKVKGNKVGDGLPHTFSVAFPSSLNFSLGPFRNFADGSTHISQ